MTENQYNTKGLTNEQVLKARVKFGENKLNSKKENTIVDAAKRLVTDPMMILLLVASTIYFISGKIGDGIFLSCAIFLQASISFFQFKRSKNALNKLKDLSQPNCKVIRNGKIEEIISEQLVVGDAIIVEEGTSIMADGIIIQSNDFTVNESILTGESFAVKKDISNDNNLLYSGTTVSRGLAIATVIAIGNQTKSFIQLVLK
jgi:Ca2+-transporting ATPase